MNAEQREREIAEVEKEIALIENAMKIHRHNVSVGRKVCQHVKAICRWSRILAREQARLAELRRGMKEGSERVMDDKQKLPDPFAGIEAGCCEGYGYPHAMADCICGSEERVLRGYIREDSSLPPMTQEQREWCLNEIGSVEGYEREDYEHYCSADLASAVLHAWADFCRDKGLL